MDYISSDTACLWDAFRDKRLSEFESLLVHGDVEVNFQTALTLCDDLKRRVWDLAPDYHATWRFLPLPSIHQPLGIEPSERDTIMHICLKIGDFRWAKLILKHRHDEVDWAKTNGDGLTVCDLAELIGGSQQHEFDEIIKAHRRPDAVARARDREERAAQLHVVPDFAKLDTFPAPVEETHQARNEPVENGRVALEASIRHAMTKKPFGREYEETASDPWVPPSSLDTSVEFHVGQNYLPFHVDRDTHALWKNDTIQNRRFLMIGGTTRPVEVKALSVHTEQNRTFVTFKEADAGVVRRKPYSWFIAHARALDPLSKPDG